MKRSLFIKIFMGYVAIIVVLSSYLILLSYSNTRNHYIETLKKDLEEFAVLLTVSVNPLIEDGLFKELDKNVKIVGKETGRRITVIDSDGLVLADSIRNPALMDNHRNRPEVIQALRGPRGSSLRYSGTLEEKMLYVAIPVRMNEGTIVLLRISVFLRDIQNLIGELRKRILIASSIIIIISSAIAFILTRRFYSPIRQLSEAAQSVARGDFSRKVYLKSKDELKELADNYNTMTDKIDSYVKELSAQADELDCIISSIQPGLLVLNNEGKVTLYNESIKTITHTDDLVEKYYWQVLKEAALIDLIKELQSTKGSFNKEFRIADNFVLVSGTYLETLNKTVLVLHDINEMRKVEQIKKDFIVNVSHELRTPLTAIKGYSETIDGVSDENQQYLSIIKGHTDRLINIVEDLLTLSELEEQEAKLEMADINLSDAAEQVLRMFSGQLSKKGLGVKKDIQDNIPFVRADPLRIEQVFINLIDNAIKYTEKGEIKISIYREDGYVISEIRDTGIGISENYINRIFERFYTVDRSRSRKLGGTGLGLSIVKHIINNHGGTIEVESKLGVGTAFIVRLPVG
jgi:two-component system phosphate regulon sensor histidine kinase PhoR